MSHIIEQAEELRQKAIAILLQERETIDAKLMQLGHAGPPKQAKRSCSNCGGTDHNARRCPTNKAVQNLARANTQSPEEERES